ncbi:hypothetical protein ACIPJU_01570 [Micrococcus endophyticus]|uniref:hypothetical protein n=1 Tax=Micrococcus endophyticus TaxID=455343 RepID=UPI0038258E0D
MSKTFRLRALELMLNGGRTEDVVAQLSVSQAAVKCRCQQAGLRLDPGRGPGRLHHGDGAVITTPCAPRPLAAVMPVG